jgi:hypothetical protein
MYFYNINNIIILIIILYIDYLKLLLKNQSNFIKPIKKLVISNLILEKNLFCTKYFKIY